MFTIFEQREEFYKANTRSHELLRSILDELGVALEESAYSTGSELLLGNQSDCFLMTSGIIRTENQEGKILCFLEPGDMIGAVGLFTPDSRFIAHSNIRGKLGSKTALYKAFAEYPSLVDSWQEYIESQFELLSHMLYGFSPERSPFTPDVRFYHPGDPILIQETTPKEVFTMLYGSADVYVQDTNVGEVLPGEIFGAMSASTKTRRSASVIARTQCAASVLHHDMFLELIRTHPRTVHKLVGNMARVIVSQNERIVDFEE